ncbi:hypothetical protein Fmac_015206 [Flemingia macrophylla]|uniref:G-patch domain-containing protein n=1 Tax=Flemingia macrophylla TaxID=520843 RepID=A0ABD1MER4_9FABA
MGLRHPSIDRFGCNQHFQDWGMTRSGRIYTPDKMQDKVPKEKNRAEEKEKELEEEAYEFLKFIRQSEYSIIDQLNRTPAKITLLSLIVSLKPPRQALLKVLNKVYVTHSISQDKFEGTVSHIIANNHLSFTNEEILSEGANHNKSLHIFVKCTEYFIVKVLVDNRSSLNVMPMRTLKQVILGKIQICPSNMIVQAFNGSKREVVGKVTLPIQVGATIFNVEFQVMDITLAYIYLLGRPWIHDAKAVPSTLHQKIKFVVSDKLVTVQAEDDMFINKPLAIPYVDAAEEAIKIAFQELKLANIEKIPHKMKTVAQMMIKTGYQPGRGLGKYSQGITELPVTKDNLGKQGLGYDPTKDKHVSKDKTSLSRSLNQVFRKARIQVSNPTVVIRCSPSLQGID